MVAIFLLHARGESRVRSEASGRDQAGDASDLEGDGSLRERAGARRAAARRWRLHAAVRLCAADLNDVPYDRWREYDPEDTIRFYTLRMRDSGFIKSTPQKIIAESTDWHFLDELKRELKA